MLLAEKRATGVFRPLGRFLSNFQKNSFLCHSEITVDWFRNTGPSHMLGLGWELKLALTCNLVAIINIYYFIWLAQPQRYRSLRKHSSFPEVKQVGDQKLTKGQSCQPSSTGAAAI